MVCEEGEEEKGPPSVPGCSTNFSGGEAAEILLFSTAGLGEIVL